MYDLKRLPGDRLKGGAPRLMAPDDLTERSCERDGVNRAAKADGNRFIIRRHIGQELAQEPQPQLRKGQWQASLTRLLADRGDGQEASPGTERLQMPGQARNRWR